MTDDRICPNCGQVMYSIGCCMHNDASPKSDEWKTEISPDGKSGQFYTGDKPREEQVDKLAQRFNELFPSSVRTREDRYAEAFRKADELEALQKGSIERQHGVIGNYTTKEIGQVAKLIQEIYAKKTVSHIDFHTIERLKQIAQILGITLELGKP